MRIHYEGPGRASLHLLIRLLLAFLAMTAAVVMLVRRAGFHILARENVSAKGGNTLAFVLMKWLITLLFGIVGPLEVEGREHVPKTGGFILAPNHSSDCDVLALYVALPRWAWFMGKEQLFSIRLLGKLIQYYHAFPIRREGPADRTAMKQVLEHLSDGEPVVIFPEGRLAEDGYLQPFQPGTAMLALRAGVPVVPVAMNGTNRVLPYGHVWPKVTLRRVKIRFGPAIDLSDLAARTESDKHERQEAATARIRQGMVTLLREIAPERLSAEERG